MKTEKFKPGVKMSPSMGSMIPFTGEIDKVQIHKFVEESATSKGQQPFGVRASPSMNSMMVPMTTEANEEGHKL